MESEKPIFEYPIAALPGVDQIKPGYSWLPERNQTSMRPCLLSL
ncbi:hypothetical protein BDE02_15G027100 [Populus trichocarpa]|nr:hypothetical protein BDE02_15G027100 [Populus trichocarpa]